MSTSSYDSVFGLRTERLTVPVGATLALFVEGIDDQNSLTMQYLSGGTLEIIGATYNTGTFQTTLPVTSLATLSGTGYLVPTSIAITFDGAPRFYLSATSATTIVQIIRGIGQ